MNEIMISVIIPVFEGEKTIAKSIESVLNQTYLQWELIIIDDGSNDGTLKICKKYIEKDSRVNVISKQNEGVSKARNLGISKAQGDYIVFLDADDYIDSYMFQELVDVLKKDTYDLICFGLIKEFEDGSIIKYDRINSLRTHNVKYECYSSELFGYACNKLYSKKIIDKYNIKFNSAMKIFEDEVFNCNFFKYTDKIHIIQTMFYHYVQYKDTSQATKKIYLDILQQSILRFNAWKQLEPNLVKVRLNKLSYESSKDVILLCLNKKQKISYQEMKYNLRELRKSEIYNCFENKQDKDWLEIMLYKCIKDESYAICLIYNMIFRFLGIIKKMKIITLVERGH